MAFNNYLEDENDKPYFKLNSLAYYYDKMEGFAKAVDGSAKALNLTKEEVEKRLTLYIEQNKNELDQRLAQWDGKLETFDSSVETLLTEWVDNGTLNNIIDSTLIDQRIAPVTAQLEDKAGKDETVKTQSGRPAKMIFGVIRNVSGTWEFIEDSTHAKLGFSSLEILDGDLALNYDFVANKVGTFVVTPDETMAAKNVGVGSSVGVSQARLRFYEEVECTLNASGNIVNAPSYMKGIMTSTLLEDGSGVKLTHPVLSTNDVPQATLQTETNTIKGSSIRTSWTTSDVTLRHYSILGGYISYDGTEFTCLTDAIDIPTVAYDEVTGILTVTHTANRAVSNNYGITLVEREGYTPVLSTMGHSSFQVKFRDYAGNFINPPSSAMRFYFTRNIDVPTTMPGSFVMTLKRGKVKVPADKMITGGSGNFWLYGAMNL